MQPLYSLNYSSEARENLRDIQDYIVSKSGVIEIATGQVMRITAAARSLTFFPKVHRVRGKDRFGNELRVCPVDNYIILYSIDEVERVVNISRVLYGRRNIDSLP